MTTLPFNRGDVSANRSGKISYAQRARILENIEHLRTEARAHAAEATFVALGLVLVAVIGGLSTSAVLLVAGVNAVLLAGFVWLDGRRLRRLHRDVEQLRVASYAGQITATSWLDRAGIKRYGVQAGGRVFRVPLHVYDRLDATQTYRVYWGAHSGELLSMEEGA